MLDFQQKRRLKAILLSPFTKVLLILLTLFVAYSAFTRYQVAAEMTERRNAVDAEIAEMQANRAQLEAEVEYLSDDRGIEGEMRRQFDIALPGEEVVVILEDETSAAPATVTDSATEEKPWFVFW